MASKVPERLVAKRGVFMKIWDNFLASLSVSSRRTIVGEDHLGNLYYEADPRFTSKRGSLARGYLPGSTKNWKEIPPEWESWLRGRRHEIPSQEEIDRNMAIAELKKQRAAELDAKRLNEDAQQLLQADSSEPAALNAHSLTESPATESTTPTDAVKRAQELPHIGSDTGDQHRTSYPTYGTEYEAAPGVKYADFAKRSVKEKE